MKFGIFLENYHKIIWTAIIQSSHLVKAKDFKTGKILTEKLWKQIIWSIFFLVNYECDIAQNSFCRHKNITFCSEVWCFCLFIFACTILFIRTNKYNTTFTNCLISRWKMFSRQPDRWYRGALASCNRSVQISICFVVKIGLD